MKAILKEQLGDIIEHVNNIMVDPEINIDYFIPDTNKLEDCYISVEYIVSEYTKPKRKINLSKAYTVHEAHEIANMITFSIGEFKAEIDSVQMGA